MPEQFFVETHEFGMLMSEVKALKGRMSGHATGPSLIVDANRGAGVTTALLECRRRVDRESPDDLTLYLDLETCADAEGAVDGLISEVDPSWHAVRSREPISSKERRLHSLVEKAGVKVILIDHAHRADRKLTLKFYPVLAALQASSNKVCVVLVGDPRSAQSPYKSGSPMVTSFEFSPAYLTTDADKDSRLVAVIKKFCGHKNLDDSNFLTPSVLKKLQHASTGHTGRLVPILMAAASYTEFSEKCAETFINLAIERTLFNVR